MDPAYLLEYPKRKGAKSGLFRTKIGLDMPIRQALLHRGDTIRVECMGEVRNGQRDPPFQFSKTVFGGQVEDGVIQGWSEGSSSHLIQTVRLPEALKKEVTGVFVGGYMHYTKKL